MGKNKKPGEAQSEHVSRPLAALKDPSSFGPPPRNVNYHGGAALPNEITPHTGGWGAPMSQTEIERAREAAQGPPPEEVEEEKPAGPPVPYRADRTGLQTNHLPPPPVHRNVASPPPVEMAQPAKPKPGLPPRLPSRQASTPVPTPASPPPPSYDAVNPAPATTSANGGLNTAAMNRLGKAGVSIPGFGIGKNNNNNDATTTTTTTPSNPWSNERSSNTTSPAAPIGSNGLSELQSRFSRMNKTSPAATASDPASAQLQEAPARPSWQQSQSALRTASNFHQNPSSVSMADAQSAAATANSAARSGNAFREKHSDQIAVANQRATAFNQKYKVGSRFEKFLDKHAPLEGEQTQQQAQTPGSAAAVAPPPQTLSPTPSSPAVQKPPSPELTASISRKPPPPPPPKKPMGLHGNATAAAPPVPLGTKPGYS